LSPCYCTDSLFRVSPCPSQPLFFDFLIHPSWIFFLVLFSPFFGSPIVFFAPGVLFSLVPLLTLSLFVLGPDGPLFRNNHLDGVSPLPVSPFSFKTFFLRYRRHDIGIAFFYNFFGVE